MRTTQFIGLTRRAEEFLESVFATDIESESFCEGMFGEKIPLRRYKFVDEYGEEQIAREIVQTEIWSSGPMIFTYLEISLNGSDSTENHWFSCCQWIDNPLVGKAEYDYEKGEMWI